MMLEERLMVAEEGSYTGWMHAASDLLSPPAFSHSSPLMMMAMPLAAAPPQRLPVLTATSVERCQYRSKFCRNHRAFKANGTLHRLCEFHRYKANENQKRWTQARRTDDIASQDDNESVSAESPTADGHTRPRRRRQLIDKTQRSKLGSEFSPVPMWPYAPYWPMETIASYSAVDAVKSLETDVTPPLSGMDLDLLTALLVDGEPREYAAEQETVV